MGRFWAQLRASSADGQIKTWQVQGYCAPGVPPTDLGCYWSAGGIPPDALMEVQVQKWTFGAWGFRWAALNVPVGLGFIQTDVPLVGEGDVYRMKLTPDGYYSYYSPTFVDI